MTEPTLEDDLTALRSFAESLAEDHEREATLGAALDRVSAALEDLEHLEKGAQLLQYIFDCADVDVDPGELDVQRTQAWLESERARKAKGT